MSGCSDPGCRFFESGSFCDVHFRKSDILRVDVFGPRMSHHPSGRRGCRFFESGRLWESPPLPPSIAGVMSARIGGTPPRGMPSIRGLKYLQVPRLKQDNDRLAPNTPAFLPRATLSPRLHVGPTVCNRVGTWGNSYGLGNGKVVAKPPRIAS